MSLKFPIIDASDCPTADGLKCPDDSFLSTQSPRLILKPEVSMLCADGTVQLQAFVRSAGGEQPLSSGVTFASSDTSVCTVNANGLVTAVGSGEVTISANWSGQSAFAKIAASTTALCCDGVIVGTVLVIDHSPSMGEAFSVAFPTALYVAKDIAKVLATALNGDKDLMAVCQFDADNELILSLTGVNADVISAINSITVSNGDQEITDLHNALIFAVARANACATCSRKVVVLISDGIYSPAPGSSELAELLAVAQGFKDTGGIIECVGLRASGDAYAFLQTIATNGFFVNVTSDDGSVAAAKATLLGLRGNYCGGDADAPDAPAPPVPPQPPEPPAPPMPPGVPPPPPVPPDDTESNNEVPLSINDANAATPYPGKKYVSGLTGTISGLTVSITGLTHTAPYDVRIVLESPAGTTCQLMAAVAGPEGIGVHSASGINLVFSDAAGSSLPASSALSSGTFKPTANTPLASLSMPPPCPHAPYGTVLTVFNGESKNGSWKLWVCDSVSFDAGMIASWDIAFA